MKKAIAFLLIPTLLVGLSGMTGCRQDSERRLKREQKKSRAGTG